MSGILRKIQSRGSWTVRIYPVEYQANKISSLSDLEQAVRASVVELRGWSFPRFDYRSNLSRFSDHIEQEVDWQHHVEIWRAYKSGQFVSSKGLISDWRDQSNLWPFNANSSSEKIMYVKDAIFTLIEIVEFAARWAKAIQAGEEMTVECVIKGLEDRILKFEPFGPLRVFSYERACRAQEWSWYKNFSTSLLFSTPRDLAVEPAINLFELFSWDVAEESVRNIQNELRP